MVKNCVENFEMKILSEFKLKTRPVWTGFKIAVRLKLLTHYNNRLCTTYKKANSKYYCFILK